MAMTVKEVAELIGVSVRTLHHYDQIGLLSPGRAAASGYRLYSDDDLRKLQQILLFREMGLPLTEIKRLIDDPSFNRLHALTMHREFLLEQKRRLDRMIETVERSIRHEKGELEMTGKQHLEGFDFSRNPYEEEARKLWGDRAVDEANARVGAMSSEEQAAFGEDMYRVYRKLAELRGTDPTSDEAQAAIGEWYELLNRFGHYTPEMFKGLGQMYVDDERFTKSIDRFGAGLARFMRDAMAAFADRRQQTT
jgi:Predicted transcriptional regulators